MFGYKKSTLERQSLSDVKMDSSSGICRNAPQTLDIPSPTEHKIIKRFREPGDISVTWDLLTFYKLFSAFGLCLSWWSFGSNLSCCHQLPCSHLGPASVLLEAPLLIYIMVQQIIRHLSPLPLWPALLSNPHSHPSTFWCPITEHFVSSVLSFCFLM